MSAAVTTSSGARCASAPSPELVLFAARLGASQRQTRIALVLEAIYHLMQKRRARPVPSELRKLPAILAADIVATALRDSCNSQFSGCSSARPARLSPKARDRALLPCL